MPSTSKKQHNFMAAVANNPSFAKKAGVPQSVGKEFNNADKGKSFKQGGDMASKMNPGFMAMMAKKKSMQEGSKADMASDKKQMMGMKKGGMHKMPDGKMMKDSAMKHGGGVKKMAGGGAMPMKDGKPAFLNDGKGMRKGGMAMKKMAMGGYAGGGSASKRADGIASKGKTKGKMLAKGGATKKYC